MGIAAIGTESESPVRDSMRRLTIPIAVWMFIGLQVITVPAFARGFGGGGGFHGGGGHFAGGHFGGGRYGGAAAVTAGEVVTGAAGTVDAVGMVVGGTGAAGMVVVHIGMAVLPTGGGVTHTRMVTDLMVGKGDKQKSLNRGWTSRR
jgi:hypothetical protein